MKNIFKTLFIICIGITLIISLCYLVVDYKGTTGLITLYNQVGQSKNTNTVGGKKLNFLTSYYSETGDLTLSNSVKKNKGEDGMSESGGSSDGNIDEETDTSNFPDLGIEEQIKELQTNTKYNNSYYKNYLKTYILGSKLFVYESQSGNAWNSYQPSQSTMRSAGCFYYATCAAISTISGKVYTIEDCLKDAGANVGFNSSGVFTVNPKNVIPDLNGSIDRLRLHFNNAGVSANISSVSSINEDKLKSGRTIYIIYSTADTGGSTKLRSGTMHWTVVVGLKNSGGQTKYLVLCNGNRGVEIDSSEFARLKYRFEINF